MFGLLRLTCRSTRRILWEYALDRLSEGPMESVEAHLAQCNACQKELASVRRAQSLLAACREHVPPPPRTDWATLRSRLIAEGQPNSTESRESSPTYRGVSVQSLLEPRPAYRVRTKRYQLGIVGGMATFLLTAAVGYHSMLPANVAGTSPGKTMTAQPSLTFPKRDLL